MRLEFLVKRLIPAIMLFFLFLGVGLRFYNIGEFFSDVDDISPIVLPYLLKPDEQRTVQLPLNTSITVNKEIIKSNPFLYAGMVSKYMTYAPLQYLLYPILLKGEYRYKEFLARGRIPSAMLGVLALLIFCIFYWRYNGSFDVSGILGMCIFSLSLMNIIYSQQTLPYAAGVFSAAALMLLVLIYYAKEKTIFNLLLLSFLSALLSYSNYQVIMLVAALYAALFLIDFKEKKAFLRLYIIKYGISVIMYGFLMAPLYLLFLKEKTGVGHFRGIVGFENYFPSLPVEGVSEKIFYIFKYAANSFYTVVETNTAFSDGGFLMVVCTILFFILFLFGILKLSISRDKGTKAIGLFILCVAVIWVIMNIKGKFPLSPTRHVLLLTPFVLFIIVMGAKFLLETLKDKYIAVGNAFILMLVIIISIGFFMNYGSFRAARKDRFNEDVLSGIMEANNITTIVGYEYTYNPIIMFKKSDKNYKAIYINTAGKKELSDDKIPPVPFVLISHNKPIEEDHVLFASLNSLGYRIKHVVDIQSDVQVGISNKIKYYTNGLYISIAGR